jgi:Uma2 family endonuclease
MNTVKLPPSVKNQIKTISLIEFLQLPETKPASEYIDGEISQKDMPKGQHSSIQTELASYINSVLRKDKIARAFSELRCTFDDRSIVPDVAVFTWEKIPRNPDGTIANIFNLPPDWMIEILSPEQSQTKLIKKIRHCLQHGTQICWLIDPEEKTIFVYQLKQDIEIFDQPEDLLIVPDFAQKLQLTHGDLFAWLLE